MQPASTNSNFYFKISKRFSNAAEAAVHLVPTMLALTLAIWLRRVTKQVTKRTRSGLGDVSIINNVSIVFNLCAVRD